MSRTADSGWPHSSGWLARQASATGRSPRRQAAAISSTSRSTRGSVSAGAGCAAGPFAPWEGTARGGAEGEGKVTGLPSAGRGGGGKQRVVLVGQPPRQLVEDAADTA